MNFFESVVTFPARRPKLALVIGLMLLALSLGGIARFRPDTSLENLYARNDPSAQALARVMRDFSAVEELILLVSTDQPEPAPERLLAFAARFEQSVNARASQLSAGVVYRVDPETRQFFEKVLVPNGLFYLDDAAFRAARQRLTYPEMEGELRQNRAMLATPGPAANALAKTLLKDPLHLRDFILDKVAAGRPFKTYQNSDAFLSPDGKSLLIRIRGRRPVTDLDYSREFTGAISGLADKSNTDHLRLAFTGSYAIAATAERSIRRDMITGIFASVISLQVLFLLVYRRPFRSFLLGFAPVAIGIVYGFGGYSLITTTLTPMSAVIGGVLAGMGIDYSIQYLAHYDVGRSAIGTSRKLSPAMLAAWITSVFGFIAIGSSQVKALRDFSLLGTLGLSGAFAGALFLLPAALALLDRGPLAAGDSICRISLIGVLQAIARRTRGILICAAVVLLTTGALLLHAPDLFSFESDLTVMHPRPNPPLEAQRHVAERMGTSPGALIVHLRASSDEALLTLAHQVDSRLRIDAVHQAGIENIFGLASLLPDPAIASSRLAETGEATAAKVLADFHRAVSESDFSPAAYEPYGEFLHHILTRTAPPGIDDLRRFPSLAATVLPKSRNDCEALVYIFTRGDDSRQTRDATIDVVRNALRDCPGATLTGLSVLSHDAEQSVRRDLPRLAGVAVIAVAAYLLLQFRAVLDCLLALLPMAVSMVALLAFMQFAGIRLNMINLVAFPLLIGIDVDYGVFLVASARLAQARQLSRSQLAQQVAPSALAVLLCAAATILGFGSLIFNSVPAARSLGICVSVGVIACVAAVFFVVLPILFTFSKRK